jgi:small-conductance mechanosensitive channel
VSRWTFGSCGKFKFCFDREIAQVTDALTGFIILIDQPFRVGDDILIRDLNTQGNVMEIGTRTTRIRTHDNREVIIPNSQMSQSQVVNYTYPDPKYRLQTDIGVAYGADFHKMRQVINETVRAVEGVLEDKAGIDLPFDTYNLIVVLQGKNPNAAVQSE